MCLIPRSASDIQDWTCQPQQHQEGSGTFHSVGKETEAQRVSELPKALISCMSQSERRCIRSRSPRSGISYAHSPGPQKFSSTCELKTKHLARAQGHAKARLCLPTRPCHRLLTWGTGFPESSHRVPATRRDFLTPLLLNRPPAIWLPSSVLTPMWGTSLRGWVNPYLLQKFGQAQ